MKVLSWRMRICLILTLVLVGTTSVYSTRKAQQCASATALALQIRRLEGHAFECARTKCSDMDIIVQIIERMNMEFDRLAGQCLDITLEKVTHETYI